MTDPIAEPQEKKFNFLGLVIGLGVSLIALLVLFNLVDFDEVILSIQNVDLSVLPWAILLFILSMVTRSVAWRTILQDKISLGKTFLTINEGYLFNNILPFRMGEVARAFLLNKTAKIPFWEVLSTIMVERIIDIAFLATLLLSTVPFVVGVGSAEQAAYVASVLVIVGFSVLFWIARNTEKTIRIFERLTARWPKLTEFGRDKLESILNGLATLKDFKRFMKVLFFILLSWSFNIAWYTLLLRAFVPEASLLWGAFAVGFISIGISIPSSPGYVGVFEAAMTYALSLFSIPESTAFAYAVVSHSLYLVITILIGAVALGRDGQSLGQVFRGIRKRE